MLVGEHASDFVAGQPVLRPPDIGPPGHPCSNTGFPSWVPIQTAPARSAARQVIFFFPRHIGAHQSSIGHSSGRPKNCSGWRPITPAFESSRQRGHGLKRQAFGHALPATTARGRTRSSPPPSVATHRLLLSSRSSMTSEIDGWEVGMLSKRWSHHSGTIRCRKCQSIPRRGCPRTRCAVFRDRNVRAGIFRSFPAFRCRSI